LPYRTIARATPGTTIPSATSATSAMTPELESIDTDLLKARVGELRRYL
jgi:hypothetical protein